MKRLLLILTILCTYQYSIAQSKRAIDNDKLLEYYQSQQYVEAANYLQNFYNEDTQNPKEIKQLAYAYVMAGKLPEAEKNYLKLYEQQPKSLSILFSLANINTRRGNDEKAKEYYQEIIRNDSTSFNAYKGLAELYKSEDRKTIDKKMSILFTANKLNPIDPDVAYDLCETYFKMENFSHAMKVLDTALAADSTNLRLLKMKMPIGIATKNYKTSVETGEVLLKLVTVHHLY
jgi:tetratricopeptide (TPR) repeat protein